jgi:hypothetical protein
LPAPAALDALESAKLIHESAKPISPTDAALKVPELAKPTSESIESTPAVPSASKVSSDDFATTVAALVGMEVHKVPDEEMVDYEATLERVEINVLVLSANYYIVADDSTAAKFNFATESAIF